PRVSSASPRDASRAAVITRTVSGSQAAERKRARNPYLGWVDLWMDAAAQQAARSTIRGLRRIRSPEVLECLDEGIVVQLLIRSPDFATVGRETVSWLQGPGTPRYPLKRPLFVRFLPHGSGFQAVSPELAPILGARGQGKSEAEALQSLADHIHRLVE